MKSWKGRFPSRMTIQSEDSLPIRTEMSLKELSQLYYLDKLLQRNARRIEEMRARLTGTTPKLNGMPGRPGASDKIGDGIPEIVDLMRKLEDDRLNFEIEKAKLENYLRQIEDTQTRLIFILRFVDLKSWAEVALQVGGSNTEDSVKKACYRYLKGGKRKTCPECPDHI